MGKIFVQFAAIFDEYYAEDISQRAKDSIQYRKAKGISVGKPPFGTVRGKDGFLQPSPEGAWLLPNGRFAAGSADECPEEGAVWRGYYDCARYVLDLYAKHDMGYEKIAYRLNEEGWSFCDRQGEPRPIDREDVRRVLGAWPEYGGAVLDEKAKDRRAYEDLNVEDVALREDRAVFPLDLLRRVGRIRNSRSRKPVDHGVNRETFPYALNNITFCAHCLKLAEEQDDPRLKSTLGGINMNGTRRYRHKAGVSCGVTNRSVPCDDYEVDVGRLLRLLEITPEALEYMTELAIQADLQHKPDQGDVDPEREKQEAIALCNRRIDAAVTLYKEGRIDIDEYHDIVTRNEREIAHWQMRTSEMEQIAVELAMCMDVVNKVADLWDTASPEDRQGMARNLFEYLVYDLDTRRITDFRLKPWADRFLILRAQLYDDDPTGVGGEESGAGEGKENPYAPGQDLHTELPHRGLRTTSFPKVAFAVRFATAIAYYGRPLLPYPATNGTVAKRARNEEIRHGMRKASESAILLKYSEFQNSVFHKLRSTSAHSGNNDREQHGSGGSTGYVLGGECLWAHLIQAGSFLTTVDRIHSPDVN